MKKVQIAGKLLTVLALVLLALICLLGLLKRYDASQNFISPTVFAFHADKIRYAQARYIADGGATLTDTVKRWKAYLPKQAVMPHPSPRNRRWLSDNPWFEVEAIPAIRARVRDVLDRKTV